MITREQEIFAAALMIERRLGEDGPHYIAEQPGGVARREDPAGIARWRTSAAACASLQRGTRQ